MKESHLTNNSPLYAKAYSKKKLSFLLLLISSLFFISLVSAVECGSTPTEDCTITQNTTFIGATYNFYDPDGDGGIQITGNNLILDCNNSIFIGNLTTNSVGVRLSGFPRNNITIKNCEFRNYSFGIKAERLINSNVVNLTTTNDNLRGILFRDVNNTNFSQLNISGSSDGILQDNSLISHNNTISNSIFYSRINFIALFNMSIYSNNFYNITFNEAIKFSKVSSSSIYSNNFTNMTKFSAILISDKSDNIDIYSNIINLSSVGIWLEGMSNNLNITLNKIDRLITNYDGMNVGILLENQTTNNYITFNNITNYGTSGILSLGSNNTYINNNILNAYPISSKIGSVNDGHYPSGIGIQITELFKTWTNDLTEVKGDNVSTKFYNYQSYNVTIENNTMDNNNQIYLYTGGATNITHDITNYKYFSWQLPYLLSKEEYFISPLFNNLSTVNNSFVYQNTLFQGYQVGAAVGKQDVNYKWFNDYIYFKSVNWTWNYNASIMNNPYYPYFQINVYNLTNALAYNTNGTLFGNSNISANDGQITFYLGENNESFVLDNFNVSEGVSRANSPLALTKPKPNEFHITSTLASGVDLDGVPIIFNQDCDALDYLIYTSDSGATDYRPNFTCTNNQVIVTINGIEGNSLTSNVIYVVETSTGGGGSSGTTNPSETYTEDFTDDTVVPYQDTSDSSTEEQSVLDVVKQYLSGNANEEEKKNALLYLFIGIGVIIIMIIIIIGIIEVTRKK